MTAAEKKDEKVEDVEMKDETEKEEKKDPDLLTVEDIREHCKLIRRSVETKESRYKFIGVRNLLSMFYHI